MKKNNKGFTLSEVLVALVIIGVIMALSVQTFKIIKTSYTPLTYFTLKNIKSIVNILTTTTISEEVMISCKNSNNEIVKVFKPDGYTSSGSIPACSSLPSGSGNLFCDTIVDKVANTAGGASTCSKIYEVNTSTSEPSIKFQESDRKTPCRYKFAQCPYTETFKVMNGQYYYVSEHISQAAAGADFEYGYRLIAVDLNGQRPPNTAVSTNQPPDIVTFMIMDNGDIYPLGVAADNYAVPGSGNRHINYIATALKGYCYPKITNDSSGQNVASFAHCPLTDAAYIPADCVMNTAGGSQVDTCYYKIERPSNVLSYRNAFCSVVGNIATAGATSYKTYCTGAGLPQFRQACPPFTNDDGKKFDLCAIENIKPLFRFNFD